MTHEEIIIRKQELRRVSVENNRKREILLENERIKHRDNVINETDRHRLEIRRIEAEAQAKADEVQSQKDLLAVEEAKLRDQENQQ